MRLIRLVVLAVVGCLGGAQLAHADMYTWVDAKGVVNVSNLEPPAGARVTGVTRDTPQAVAARQDAAREAARQLEMQALSDRVRQLEGEVQVARQPVAPPPATVAYVAVPMPIVVAYPSESVPAPARGCDPSWYGCWASGLGLFPPSVVVLGGVNDHRRPNVGQRPHGFPMHRPGIGFTNMRGR